MREWLGVAGRVDGWVVGACTRGPRARGCGWGPSLPNAKLGEIYRNNCYI